MNPNFPDENTLRAYVLAGFDDQEEKEKSLSEQILLSDELSEIVDSIEEEIIEDHLDGTLSSSEEEAFNKRLRQSSELQEKLSFATLLRAHFGKKTGVAGESIVRDLPKLIPERIAIGPNVETLAPWRSHLRTYCELAVLVVLTLSSFLYISSLQEISKKKQTQLQKDLIQERKHSDNLTAELQQLHPETARVIFYGPVPRDNSDSHSVRIKPSTQRVNIEINLAGVYDVRLEPKPGTPSWFQSNLSATSDGLFFEVPAKAIGEGTNCLVVTSQQQPASSSSHCFRAERTE